ncbi:hypothetical protein SNEBB_008515 [Seison nebaliae]|nr:hypothetical protein SNEBB_008515 [Seison nebaliae]
MSRLHRSHPKPSCVWVIVYISCAFLFVYLFAFPTISWILDTPMADIGDDNLKLMLPYSPLETATSFTLFPSSWQQRFIPPLAKDTLIKILKRIRKKISFLLSRSKHSTNMTRMNEKTCEKLIEEAFNSYVSLITGRIQQMNKRIEYLQSQFHQMHENQRSMSNFIRSQPKENGNTKESNCKWLKMKERDQLINEKLEVLEKQNEMLNNRLSDYMGRMNDGRGQINTAIINDTPNLINYISSVFTKTSDNDNRRWNLDNENSQNKNEKDNVQLSIEDLRSKISQMEKLIKDKSPQICSSSDLPFLLHSQFVTGKKLLKNSKNKLSKFFNLLSSNDNENMKNLIRLALYQYNADKTGLPDLAMSTSGGQVIQHSQSYKGQGGKLLNFITNGQSTELRSVQTILQPNSMPGDCWAMNGDQGFVVIKLPLKSIIKSISIEHIPISVALEGQIISALRTFQVFAYEEFFTGTSSLLHSPQHSNEETKEYFLGEFEYQINTLEYIQFFDIQLPIELSNENKKGMESPLFQYIKVKILSNYGNERFTCIYRVRVHGKPVYG